jgi:hypothetical protein
LKNASFGTNFADNGLINFANQGIGISWRNAANSGNIDFTVDATDDLIISGADNLQVENTVTGSGSIAGIISYRNDATPSAGDELGSLRFDGNDDGANPQQYARILSGIADETDLSEDGQMLIQMAEAGILTNYLSFNLLNSGTVGILKVMDMNANKIDLDLDNDTSIRADTDDEIQFEVAGSDVLKIQSAGALNWNLSGVDHTLTAGSTTMEFELGAVTDSFIITFDANKKHTFTDNGQEHTSNASGSLGYTFESFFIPSTPIDDDVVAQYQWDATNDAVSPVTEPYAQMQIISTDITDGSEDGDIVWSCIRGGVLTEYVRIDSSFNEIRFANGSDLDLQAGNIDNFTQLNADSGAIATITGSRGGNAALASLLSALETYGMINDSTT